MPISWRYDRERGFIVATLFNPLELDDIRSTLASFTGSGDFPPDTPALWDARAFDFGQISREFQEHLVDTQKMYPERGTARIAVVVSNDLGYGMMRMYQALADELPLQVRVFRNIAEAERWLGGE